MTTKKVHHIPAPEAVGLRGPSMCGKWASYLTGDHAMIRRQASQPEGWCKRCYQRYHKYD